MKFFKLGIMSENDEKVAHLAGKYEGILQEYESKMITGLGNEGEPAYLDGEDRMKGEESLKTFALNTVLSDRMPLNRKLRDPRSPR